MSKKTTTHPKATEPPTPVTEPLFSETPQESPSPFNESNRILLEQLKKLTHPNTIELEQIFTLYKTFVNTNALPYKKDGCSTCGGDTIVKYYFGLMDWYNKNKSLFTNV